MNGTGDVLESNMAEVLLTSEIHIKLVLFLIVSQIVRHLRFEVSSIAHANSG
jgi:hypothetical protein